MPSSGPVEAMTLQTSLCGREPSPWRFLALEATSFSSQGRVEAPSAETRQFVRLRWLSGLAETLYPTCKLTIFDAPFLPQPDPPSPSAFLAYAAVAAVHHALAWAPGSVQARGQDCASCRPATTELAHQGRDCTGFSIFTGNFIHIKHNINRMNYDAISALDCSASTASSRRLTGPMPMFPREQRKLPDAPIVGAMTQHCGGVPLRRCRCTFGSTGE